jgi:flavin reductase (DIM6/NTAB) family NADH-FMN oxidoreductase RutF
MDTIRQTGEDIDEITSCGMTVEPAKIVRAPRIKECFVNLECRLAWRRPLHKGSLFHIFAGEVVNIAIDSEKAKLNSNGRYDNDGYIFNLHSPTDPTTGEQEPDKLGIIKPLCNMENL